MKFINKLTKISKYMTSRFTELKKQNAGGKIFDWERKWQMMSNAG